MEYFLIGVGIILFIGGIIGCFLPVLPGPGLCYAGLLSLQLRANPPFQLDFMLIWAALTIGVAIIDYLLPPLATKKFGGSKKGIWGSVIGLVLGLFLFPPFGILIGPMVGALVGEIIDGKALNLAFKAAIGSLSGFLAGAMIKLTVCLIMAYYFVTNL